MKEYITKISEPKPYQVLVCRSCDLCGEKSNRDDCWSCGNWTVNETKIKVNVCLKEGFSYPDGGNGSEWDVDVCPKCFKDKLIPWFISQGAKIKEEEWDW